MKTVQREYSSYPMRLEEIHLIDPRFPNSSVDRVRYGWASRSVDERERAKEVILMANNKGLYSLHKETPLQISSLTYVRLGHRATIDFRTFEALGRPTRIEAHKVIQYRKARKRSLKECGKEGTIILSSNFD